MIWAGHVACVGEKRNIHKILVGKSEMQGPLGRSRCRWEGSIRIDLRGMGWEGVHWIHVMQDRNQ
jgi:hypothetical protein